MKSAVNTLYRLLWQRDCDPDAYKRELALGGLFTRHWDDPELEELRGKVHTLHDQT
jgi:hypothetical protein